MEKHELWIVALSESLSASGHFALLLEEPVSKRRIPLVIGSHEAQAIALCLEQLQPARPLTHDLLYTMVQTLGATLLEVFIERIEDEVFYAQLVLHDHAGQLRTVDARPSDAIALAVRAGCPVFTTAEVLSSAGYATEEAQADAQTAFLEYTLDELEELLHKTLQQEDYKQAARVRDAIERRQQG